MGVSASRLQAALPLLGFGESESWSVWRGHLKEADCFLGNQQNTVHGQTYLYVGVFQNVVAHNHPFMTSGNY